MQRFSYSHSERGEQWGLYGRISGSWVEELRSLWRRIREQTPHAEALVDLRDVTFIDESGERLLAEMRAAGAEFAVAGVKHKHIPANLSGPGSAAIRSKIKDWRGASA
jgi:hypothetical protein